MRGNLTVVIESRSVGAGPVLSLPKGFPCPIGALTRRGAQQAAPLRFRRRNDRQRWLPVRLPEERNDSDDEMIHHRHPPRTARTTPIELFRLRYTVLGLSAVKDTANAKSEAPADVVEDQ